MVETIWENASSVFASVIPIPSRSTYIMSTRYTWCSQLAIFFNTKSKQGEETSNRILKRKRDEKPATMLVEQAWTFTLVSEDTKQVTCSLQHSSVSNKSKEQIALKLNQFKDKVKRYEPQKDLSRCIAEEPIAKCLKFELELMIGNFDQEFS